MSRVSVPHQRPARSVRIQICTTTCSRYIIPNIQQSILLQWGVLLRPLSLWVTNYRDNITHYSSSVFVGESLRYLISWFPVAHLLSNYSTRRTMCAHWKHLVCSLEQVCLHLSYLDRFKIVKTRGLSPGDKVRSVKSCQLSVQDILLSWRHQRTPQESVCCTQEIHTSMI